MKMLIAVDSDEILGFTAFGAEASELLAAVQTAMAGRVPYTDLHRAIGGGPEVAAGADGCALPACGRRADTARLISSGG